MILIYTRVTPNDSEAFERLRRGKRLPWIFVVSGEWSESPHHAGSVSFWAAKTVSRNRWALLVRGFPTRIVAVSEADREVAFEDIAGLMMWKLELEQGECVDTIYKNNPAIDFARLRHVYSGAAKDLLSEIQS